MRTTIDIPEDLLRRAKSTAALRGIKLKDLVTAYIAQGLDPVPVKSDTRIVDSEPVQYGHSWPLPEFFPRTGIPIPSMTNAEIEELFLAEDLAKIGYTGST